jgi:endonuclease III related protein
MRVFAILDLPGCGRYLAKEMSAVPQRPVFPISSEPHCFRVKLDTSPPAGETPSLLRVYFDTLFAAHGPQYWWPGRSRFEVIVGAILTQNTSWTNVEPAIANLRRAKLLTPAALQAVPTSRLARLIRSSGYFRQKAKKLKAFVRFLQGNYRGSLAGMFRTPTRVLREQLLGVHGIGPETADSILLYAGNRPVFVVDAYTRRILERHALGHPKQTYEEVRAQFERDLPADPALYNEFHALIVRTGKYFCRTRDPRCGECCLQSLLPERITAAS